MSILAVFQWGNGKPQWGNGKALWGNGKVLWGNGKSLFRYPILVENEKTPVQRPLQTGIGLRVDSQKSKV